MAQHALHRNHISGNSMEPELAYPLTAKEPFNNADADVIIRTADKVDFRIFKCMLSLTSSVFKDLLAPGGLKFEFYADPTSIPTITVSENITTIDSLLRLVYPGAIYPNPPFSSFDDAKLFLAAVAKYNMIPTIADRAKELVADQFLKEHTVSLYAVACEHGWCDLARKAAWAALKIRDLGQPGRGGYVKELETLPAAAFYRLLEYHHACGVIASELKFDSASFPPAGCPGDMDVCAWNEHRQWLGKKYVKACRSRLLTRPHPSTIRRTSTKEWLYNDERILKLHMCPSCPAQFKSFRRAYAAKVRGAISTVELEFRS